MSPQPQVMAATGARRALSDEPADNPVNRSEPAIPTPLARPTRLEFRQVSRRFLPPAGKRGAIVTAVDNLSFAIRQGEVVSIVGPRGCGKSTLLNMASGLAAPSAGTVLVDGARVEGPNQHIAFMLQKDLLLPWRTIRENIEFGMEIQGVAAAERRHRALDWLQRCRIAEFADKYPSALSGGMRQRAALARTLVTNPSVLMLDEPVSALDAQTKMVLQENLAQMLREADMTALFITHDLAEAAVLSDRVLVMSPRPGTLIAEITLDLPPRASPMQRRRESGLTHYVAAMMALLHIGEEAPH